jgi:hypothetical protein
MNEFFPTTLEGLLGILSRMLAAAALAIGIGRYWLEGQLKLLRNDIDAQRDRSRKVAIKQEQAELDDEIGTRLTQMERAHERAMERECADRKLADGRIEERARDMVDQLAKRLADVATETHVSLGKIDVLQRQIHETEMKRLAEVAELRSEMRVGFESIRGAIKNHLNKE